MSETTSIPPLGPGIKPFFFPDSGATKYGLKTGLGIVELLPMAKFALAPILSSIQEMGFMNPFEPVEKELKLCEEEEFLVVTDVKSVYGEMFLLYYTTESINGKLNELNSAKEAESAALALLEAQAAQKAAEEHARKNAVYVDLPFLSRPYISSTQTETESEIASNRIIHERPLLKLTIGRNVNSCGRKLNLGSRDCDVSGLVEFRSQKMPEFDLNFKVRDIGVQACKEVKVGGSQTSWNTKVNVVTQFDGTSTGTSTGTGIGTGTGTDDVPETNEEDDQEEINQNIKHLLKNVLPDIEAALQQNETINIFASALSLSSLGDFDDGIGVGNKMSNHLKEMRNFTDLEYSKGKTLACINWHPTKKGVLGASVVKPLSFDDRISISGANSVSHIIIWEFAEWIKPQLVLQCPHDCFTFKFNVTMPDVIVGGTFSGQIVLWNLTDAMKEVERKKVERKLDDGDDDYGASPVLTPSCMSHIDSSHKRMIADLDWLPADSQVNFRGQLIPDEYLDGKSYQFATIAGDGQALVWDIRYEEIAKGNLLHVFKPKASSQEKVNKDGTVNKTLWKPLFRMNLKRLEGVGELSLCKFLTGLGGADKNDGVDRRSQMVCESEEGDLVFADFRAKAAVRSDNNNSEGEDEGSDIPEYVKFMSKDHNRPCVSLHRSPFYPSMIISVSDWNFHIWRIDTTTIDSNGKSVTSKPIKVFTSPDASTYLTSGAWSPTRPGVILLSKADGCIDVWDFTDSSFRPSHILMTTPSRITSLQFLTGKTSTSKQQLLAVGDCNGSLHVFDVPKVLWKSVLNELSVVEGFFNREVMRMTSNSDNEEDGEKAKVKGEGNDDTDVVVRGGGGGMGVGEEKEKASRNNGEGEGGVASKEENENELEMMKAGEKEYMDLEARFILELKLTEEELPEGFDMSRLEIGGKDFRRGSM